MWTAQQIIEAFPHDSAPRWLLRDRDGIYSEVFRRRVAKTGARLSSVAIATVSRAGRVINATAWAKDRSGLRSRP
jgi:hypothetical protein